MTKQSVIPGTMSKRVKPVHDKAMELCRLDTIKKDADRQHKDAKEALIKAMKKAKLNVYRHGNILVTVDESTTVKARIIAEDEPPI